jgi:hypothetical protein
MQAGDGYPTIIHHVPLQKSSKLNSNNCTRFLLILYKVL